MHFKLINIRLFDICLSSQFKQLTLQILGQIALREKARAKRRKVVDILKVVDRHAQAVRVRRVQTRRELQRSAYHLGAHIGHPILLARVVAHADRYPLDKELGVMLDDALQQQLGQLIRRHHGESDVHDDALDQLLNGGDLCVVRVDRVVHIDLGHLVRQPVLDVAV